jgi:ketosteroid isomerase-like protein
LTGGEDLPTLRLMSTMDIAKKYVELCSAHQNHLALETLFSPDIVSVEAGTPPGATSAETKGVKAVAEKGKQWMENHEIHSSKVEGPWPHGDKFIVRFSYDVTNKPSGRRFPMEEAALFTVAGGKITREEFFYSTGG